MTTKQQTELTTLENVLMQLKKAGVNVFAGPIYDHGHSMTVIVLPDVILKDGKLLLKDTAIPPRPEPHKVGKEVW